MACAQIMGLIFRNETVEDFSDFDFDSVVMIAEDLVVEQLIQQAIERNLIIEFALAKVTYEKPTMLSPSPVFSPLATEQTPPYKRKKEIVYKKKIKTPVIAQLDLSYKTNSLVQSFELEKS